jgi:hypothetical protein
VIGRLLAGMTGALLIEEMDTLLAGITGTLVLEEIDRLLAGSTDALLVGLETAEEVYGVGVGTTGGSYGDCVSCAAAPVAAAAMATYLYFILKVRRG